MAESSGSSTGSLQYNRNEQSPPLREISSTSEEETSQDDARRADKAPKQVRVRTESTDSRRTGYASSRKTDSGGKLGLVHAPRKPAEATSRNDARARSLGRTEALHRGRSRADASSRLDENDDTRTLLDDKDAEESRKAPVPKSDPRRKQPVAMTTTAATTTRTTTTTTATTIPSYATSSSSSDRSDDGKTQSSKRAAASKRKRQSYVMASVGQDQQSIETVKRAAAIMTLHPAKQSAAFEDALDSAKQIDPASRCAALMQLAKSLSLFTGKTQAGYRDRLHQLADSSMPAQDRKKVIDALNCSDDSKAIAHDDAKQLRSLLLDGQDAGSIRKAMSKVLAGREDFDHKYRQLEARSAPLADDLPAYVDQYYFAAAQEYLSGISRKKAGRFPDYEQFEKEKKPYFKTLSLIHDTLPEEKLAKLRRATRQAHDKALISMLPALHAAIMNNHVPAVQAYLEAVLDSRNGLAPNELMQLLEMEHKGKTAFYRTLLHGSPELIKMFMQTILDSNLDVENKIRLLHARRKTDNVAAFYIAMSTRETERVSAFVETVLGSRLVAHQKESLLKSKKLPLKGKDTHQGGSGRYWQEAAITARAEAQRNEGLRAKREPQITAYDKIAHRMHADYSGLRDKEQAPSLVELFDQLVNASGLAAPIKRSLTQNI